MNETETRPRDAPTPTTAELIAAAVADYLKQSERRARENAKRKPKTPEQRAREALRRRLGGLAGRIEKLAEQIEYRHTDRSGGFHCAWIPPPADNSDLRGIGQRVGLLDQWERVEREAADGCVESAEFVARYGPMFRLALHLRQQRPPPRAADYHPGEELTADQWRWICGSRN